MFPVPLQAWRDERGPVQTGPLAFSLRRAFAAGMTRHVLFLCSSARADGNSVQLARLAAAGLPASLRRDWVDLTTLDLPPFRDNRPEGLPPAGDLADLADRILAASDLVFVAPVYWYALPAPAKLLLDHWSGWLDLPAMRFAERMRGKALWLVTARADPDPAVAAPVEAMLRQTAHWLGLRWGGALHGIGDAAGDVRNDHDATTRAKRFLSPDGS
jgi:NAD(P)H-dependent FMN reductase